MSEVSAGIWREQLLAVLQEGLEGSPFPWNYFTDGRAETALLGTLAALDAEQASRVVQGSSVAAHAHHVAFAARATSRWIAGNREAVDWNASWAVQRVDASGWSQLQGEVRAACDALRTAVETYAGTSPEATGAALGAVAHLAYHLGAIRQKLAASTAA